jgi:hypothetical protein
MSDSGVAVSPNINSSDGAIVVYDAASQVEVTPQRKEIVPLAASPSPAPKKKPRLQMHLQSTEVLQLTQRFERRRCEAAELDHKLLLKRFEEGYMVEPGDATIPQDAAEEQRKFRKRETRLVTNILKRIHSGHGEQHATETIDECMRQHHMKMIEINAIFEDITIMRGAKNGFNEWIAKEQQKAKATEVASSSSTSAPKLALQNEISTSSSHAQAIEDALPVAMDDYLQ